jgi:hypothetical protein
MIDTEQLLIANLTEALKQVQNYVTIALATSVSALALTTKSASKEPVKVLSVPVAVSPDVAQVILLGLVFVVGALAAYSAESINLIARQLDPKLLSAACSFPSIATSPYIGVRVLAALVPFILALAVVVRTTRSARSVGGWLVLGGAAYVPLLLQLLHSGCLSRAP